MKKQKLIPYVVIVILIVTVATGTIWIKQKNKQEVSKGQQQFEQVERSDKTTESTESANANKIKTSQGEVAVPSNLPEGLSINNFKPVAENAGDASFISTSDGKTFSLIIEAQLSPPADGKSYWAWIAKDKDFKNVFKVSMLDKNGNVYSVNFNQSGDFSTYKYIAISEETVDDDSIEKRILEGNL